MHSVVGKHFVEYTEPRLFADGALRRHVAMNHGLRSLRWMCGVLAVLVFMSAAVRHVHFVRYG